MRRANRCPKEALWQAFVLHGGRYLQTGQLKEATNENYETYKGKITGGKARAPLREGDGPPVKGGKASAEMEIDGGLKTQGYDQNPKGDPTRCRDRRPPPRDGQPLLNFLPRVTRGAPTADTGSGGRRVDQH